MNNKMTEYFIQNLIEEKSYLRQYIRRTTAEIQTLQNTIELKQLRLDMISDALDKHQTDKRRTTVEE